MPETIIGQLLDFFSSMGYPGIVFLMAIESSFIPFPSEVVIPPAAYLAQKGEMDLFLVVISGIAGSLAGAVVNYVLARTLGRAAIYSLAEKRFARFLLITPEKVMKSEEYFIKYGNISTFIGRLIVGIRQLISIPAGLARMKMGNFLFYTTLGSSIWVIILALLGYYFGEKQEVLERYYKEIAIVTSALFATAAVIYFYVKFRRKAASEKQ